MVGMSFDVVCRLSRREMINSNRLRNADRSVRERECHAKFLSASD
jgi:hypothetical protein